MRLLPLAFSLASVAFLYLAVERWRGKLAAAWSALFLGASHFFLSFSCQLRGYSLSVLTTAVGLFLILGFLESRRLSYLLLYALTGFVSVGVIPSNLLPMGALGLWAAIEMARQGWLKERSGRVQSVLVVAAPALGMFWHLWHPGVRRQFLEHLSTGKPPGSEYAVQVLGELGVGVFRDVLWLTPLMAFGLLLLMSRPGSEPGGKDWSFRVFVAAAILPLVSVYFVSLYPRNFISFLPWWFAILGISVNRSCAFLTKRWPRLQLPLVGLLLTWVLLAVVRELRVPAHYREHFALKRPQGTYYQYYQVDYHPSWVVRFLDEQDTPARRAVAFAGEDSDPVSLEFYARYFSNFRGFHGVGKSGDRKGFAEGVSDRWKIYLISNSLDNAWGLLGQLSDRQFDRDDLELAFDTGFYKVFSLRPTE
jgi:hypothetical protein